MQVFLGLDTSNYTTSLAAVDHAGNLLGDERQVLSVKQGERGLQQSEALFQHVQNLPILFARLAKQVDLKLVKGIVVSAKPRPVEGSYMPVFTAGLSQAEVLARVLQVPLVQTTHQEGHLTAGIWSAGGPKSQEFLAIHLSGGTTELLKVKRREPSSDEPMYDLALLGGTTDLHAGQFVDRVGVRLGIGFPAGPGLEVLARKGQEGRGLIPSAVQGYEVSFSGPESQAQRLIDKGTPPEQVARAVESCIAKTLVKLTAKGMAEHSLQELLVVGGVASNEFIRNELRTNLAAKLFFAEARFSSDNAVGTAVIGLETLKTRQL